MKRNKKLIAILSVFLAVIMGIYQFGYVFSAGAAGPADATQITSYKPGDEITSERTETAKKHYIGGSTYAYDVSTDAIHYKDNYNDKSEPWKDIDLSFDIQNRITKAPYELTTDTVNYSFTIKDKKTGKITVLKLIKVGEKDLKNIKKNAETSKGQILWKDVATDLDLAVTACNTQVNFDWIVKSENAPHSVEFDIQDGGIPIVYEGYDANGESVIVTSDKKDNRIVESIEKGGKYPKIINPQLRVGSSSDHGFITTYYGSYYSGNAPYVGINYNASIPPPNSKYYHFHSWYRWTGFNIPSGSTIKESSWITLRARTSLLWSGAIDTYVFFDRQASPSAPTTYNDYISRTLTSNNTAWTIPQDSWTSDTDFTSGSIASVIQELVNTYGQITTAQCMHKDYTTEGGERNKWESSYGYSNPPNYAPLLHIEYTPTCNIQSGANDNNKFAGGQEDVNSIQGVRAYLDSYNPAPVFQLSCFWVMLQVNGNRWAQCGWAKGSADATQYIWVQYIDNSGNLQNKYYSTSLNNWYNTPQSMPLGSHLYTVTYDSGSAQFQATYDNGSPLTVSVNWVPNNLQVYGEVVNCTSPNLGDHGPGDTNTKLEAQKVEKKVNGGWTNASLTYGDDVYLDYDTNVTVSPGFRVWDNRCDH